MAVFPELSLGALGVLGGLIFLDFSDTSAPDSKTTPKRHENRHGQIVFEASAEDYQQLLQ